MGSGDKGLTTLMSQVLQFAHVGHIGTWEGLGIIKITGTCDKSLSSLILCTYALDAHLWLFNSLSSKVQMEQFLLNQSHMDAFYP